MKHTFEVPIVYRGQNNYIVEAETAEDAQQITEARYYNGDDGEQTQGEWMDLT